MELITRKPIIKTHIDCCCQVYQSEGINACVKELDVRILNSKAKFPLLEYAAILFYEALPEDKHITFCSKIRALNREGGNVIIGKLLQKRLDYYHHESINMATEYISTANVWYICDIIGERVFGYSLLHQADKTIPYIKKLSLEANNWVVRSLGAGIHYAIKKGLEKQKVSNLFEILLSKANNKDKEIRQGIGWAAKTTAKFHPDVIKHFKDEIENNELTDNWFRRKIKIGLERHAYAQRNNR